MTSLFEDRKIGAAEMRRLRDLIDAGTKKETKS